MITSEAGAVAYRYRWKSGGDRDREWGMWSYSDTRRPLLDNQVEQQLYAAPPSAQAIETVAIMKCAEVADAQYQRDKPLQDAGGQDNSDGYVTGYVDGCGDCGHAIRALIPQDGRTALEAQRAEIRKQVLLEAADFVDDGEYDHHGIAAALRRMAESDKTTMEGEN